jgi:hypothetical protein
LWNFLARQLGKRFVQAVGSLLSLSRLLVLAPLGHQRLMTRHAEYALGRACISKVFDLSLAIPAAEAAGAKRLITGQDGQVFDLVATGTATVGAVVADERPVAE